MKFQAAYERCDAILNEQISLLQQGEIESIIELEQEKDQLLRQVEWNELESCGEQIELAKELLAKQQAFEHQCALVREDLFRQLSEVRKQQKALNSYLDNR
ncbi:hypothetical protein GCM10011352_37500 [Marinobacterium zhoushanense]|uniref:Flagellar protein FliT n=1 Tax=Marinobacterium zhoushanense TaxID=1679163 RepID=A0ABQ1KV15_9GAMM|nr:hypothetical protein [Marinobacterium zhoushanense]GGC07710.1 hypothetical protein GCM10011352_37500 [Marinobacterium zhoushanense]